MRLLKIVGRNREIALGGGGDDLRPVFAGDPSARLHHPPMRAVSEADVVGENLGAGPEVNDARYVHEVLRYSCSATASTPLCGFVVLIEGVGRTDANLRLKEAMAAAGVGGPAELARRAKIAESTARAYVSGAVGMDESA